VTWRHDGALGAQLAGTADAWQPPSLRRVEQRRVPDRLDDVPRAVEQAVARLLHGSSAGGGEVAVGVGSRGISRIAEIVGIVLGELKAAGFAPFIVPAMGSHGGGTVAGQLELLEGFGISERAFGVPIRATMETDVVGEVDGLPVRIDRHVVAAGRALLVNRIKPHTDFRGPIESGIAKMAVVGLGKREGAAAMHALGPPGLRDLMPEAARLVASRLLLGGVAVVENDLGQIAAVAGLRPAEIGGEPEARLLAKARDLLPRLPFGRLDVLLIDRIGKDISGTCVDPNIIDRWLVDGVHEPDPPCARIIAARALTPGSHGNALGIGLLDFVTAELASAVDLTKTYVNGITAGWSALRRTRLPICLESDHDVLRAAVTASGRRPDEPLRLLWITDTLHLAVTAASEALWDELPADGSFELAGPAFPLAFDDQGRLPLLADLG
jgi:hypothetical protein